MLKNYTINMKNNGLGDSIEIITTKTGIKSVVEYLEKKLDFDCGCDERKEKLNKMFPYQKIECLTEDEYNFLNGFNFYSNVLEPSEQKKLIVIYNRVFNARQNATSCVSCWRNIIEKLKNVYEEYKIS